MTSQWCHRNKTHSLYSELNSLQNVYLGFFIFGKLTGWRCFVFYVFCIIYRTTLVEKSVKYYPVFDKLSSWRCTKAARNNTNHRYEKYNSMSDQNRRLSWPKSTNCLQLLQLPTILTTRKHVFSVFFTLLEIYRTTEKKLIVKENICHIT